MATWVVPQDLLEVGTACREDHLVALQDYLTIYSDGCGKDGEDDASDADLDSVAITGQADVHESLVRLQILQCAHYVRVEACIRSV